MNKGNKSKGFKRKKRHKRKKRCKINKKKSILESLTDKSSNL